MGHLGRCEAQQHEHPGASDVRPAHAAKQALRVMHIHQTEEAPQSRFSPPFARFDRRMTKPQPTYDLTLLLDTAATADERKKVLKDTEAAIAKGGEVISKHDWGTRATTYEINKKTDAEYHLMQFHGSTELLEQLNRTLRITDGVLRFRIIKLAPGVGTPPDLKSAPAITTPVAEEAPETPSYDPGAEQVAQFEAESDAVAIDEAPPADPAPAEADADAAEPAPAADPA
jgi:small subunit ribosomal protein S6